jgi:glucosamine-6-phosphate deaminase
MHHPKNWQSKRTLFTAEHMFIMATGNEKADIIRKSFYNKPDAAVPASYMQTHPNLTLLLDDDIAKHLNGE